MPQPRHKILRAIAYVVIAWLIVTIVPVVVFRFVPVPTSAYMVEQQIAWLRSGGAHPPLQHRWIPLKDISPELQLAVIASEDQTFRSNWGFDFQAIARAWRYNQHHKETHGASTITQQTARNLFLWPARTWVRKGLEAYFTVLIALLWPKDRTLTVYLNSVQFGDGIYGAEAAAQAWFHRPAAKLNVQQAAQLAAVLPDPVHLHAGRPSRYVLHRAAQIRVQMHNLGLGYLDFSSGD